MNRDYIMVPPSRPERYDRRFLFVYASSVDRRPAGHVAENGGLLMAAHYRKGAAPLAAHMADPDLALEFAATGSL